VPNLVVSKLDVALAHVDYLHVVLGLELIVQMRSFVVAHELIEDQRAQTWLLVTALLVVVAVNDGVPTTR
jgi:hypothetical protein